MKTVIIAIVIILLLGIVLYFTYPIITGCKACELRGGECVYYGMNYASCKQYPHGNSHKGTLAKKPKLDVYHYIEKGLPTIPL